MLELRMQVAIRSVMAGRMTKGGEETGPLRRIEIKTRTHVSHVRFQSSYAKCFAFWKSKKHSLHLDWITERRA